ncbi:uncharacterized protein LOC114269048 [Camellia sinensis]|uniref:uncharacterized protein LOC114269048 n=1 Tax=Camellia sinensis TaxID=4442 RepID=UPI001035697F|nr:uncharacterized protein LOC114269048 [Camellia sinensis]
MCAKLLPPKTRIPVVAGMEGGLNKDKEVCPPQLPHESLRVSPDEFLKVESLGISPDESLKKMPMPMPMPMPACAQELKIPSEYWRMGLLTGTNSDFGMEGGSNKDNEVSPPQLPDLMSEGPVLLAHESLEISPSDESLEISPNEFLKVEDTDVQCAVELELPGENWRMGHRTRTNSDFASQNASPPATTPDSEGDNGGGSSNYEDFRGYALWGTCFLTLISFENSNPTI